MELIIGL